MNLKTLSFTVISLTLPALMLCAQENAAPPPQNTPPPALNAPRGLPRDGGPRQPDAQPRPDGQRGGGPERSHGDGFRRPGDQQGGPQAPDASGGRGGPMPGAQREGGAQAEWQQRQQEFAQAMQRQFAEQMQRFAEEMQRHFAEQMQRWLAQNGPQGQFNPGYPMPGQPNAGPRYDGAGAPPLGHDGGPQAGPQGMMPHHGPMAPQPRQGFEQNEPQGPWMHHHRREFGMQPGQGFAQNGPQYGPQGPWMRHHHHEFGMQWGQGFAQNRPQFGPQMNPQMWMHHGADCRRGPQGPVGMEPQMDGFHPGWRGAGPQDFRRYSREPQPQDGGWEFHPPQREPQSGGQFPHSDGRRFDQGGMNQRPGPGGPQPDNRNPAGNGPQPPHHFGPPTGDNSEPGEDGAAGPVGPQSEPAPEVQPSLPPREALPNDFGSGALPATLGDVI